MENIKEIENKALRIINSMISYPYGIPDYYVKNANKKVIIKGKSLFSYCCGERMRKIIVEFEIVNSSKCKIHNNDNFYYHSGKICSCPLCENFIFSSSF